MSKGVAFGADSGTVALALATGEATMPIPESVKVTFKGQMAEYMDFRDVVHATQAQMLKQFGGDNVFQGRVIEVHIGTLAWLTKLYLHRLDGGDEGQGLDLYFRG
jgi:aconitate hydratase 2/2-methylisocitrate dehydratase